MKHLLPFTIPAGMLLVSASASAQVFMTEQQALKAAFGPAGEVEREEKSIGPADRRVLSSSGLRFHDSAVTFLVGKKSGTAGGYALVMNEIGKSEPITFMVVMSPDQRVIDVHLMVYRESRGGEVHEKRFLRQFRGKRVADSIQINNDIINYSGATLSSQAVAQGVKRALILLKYFYPSAAPVEQSLGSENTNCVAPIPIPGEPGVYKQVRYLMGTFCEIRLASQNESKAAAAMSGAFAELRRIERVFSLYQTDSELSRVNEAAPYEAVGVSVEFYRLLKTALQYSAASGGVFDVTAGSKSQRRALIERPYNRAATVGVVYDRRAFRIELGDRSRSVRILDPDVRMDFGGLAKGYAADRAVAFLKRAGITAGLLNLGGSSLATFGNRRWTVGIADPGNRNRYALLVQAPPDSAITTSGTYERPDHLVDPLTGRSVTGLKSTSVITRSAMHGEYLAKWILLDQTAKLALPRKAEWISLGSDAAGELSASGRFKRTQILDI
jgi:FAD:protein FMN transferase